MPEISTHLFPVECDEDDPVEPVPVIISVHDAGLTIEVRNGYGHGDTIANLLVEYKDGKLRLLVWPGIVDQDGDYLHDIVLLEDPVRASHAPPSWVEEEEAEEGDDDLGDVQIDSDLEFDDPPGPDAGKSG